MGIQTSQGSGKAVFYKINAKDGCFQHRVDGVTHQFEAGRTTLVGTLIGAKFKEDEYEGVKNESVALVFKDTEPGLPNMYVEFTVASGGNPSGFGIRLLSKINASIAGEQMGLNPYIIKKGEKLGDTVFENDIVGVSVSQGGQKIKEDLGTPDNKLPTPEPVLVNGKPFLQNGRPITDKSAWGPILDAQLERLFSRFQPTESQADSHSIDPDEVAAGLQVAWAPIPDAQRESQSTAGAQAAAASSAREGMRARA